MYPLITITDSIQIYTFGLCMVVAWGVFFILLHHFSLIQGLTKHIFTDIFSFTIWSFIGARVFYMLGEWRDEKFIFIDLIEGNGIGKFLLDFFITDTYKLSLAGAIIGFLIVFFIKIRKERSMFLRSADALIKAFLITAAIGYFGALLGGQIYGISFNSPFSIQYTNKNSIVPFQNELFPLPVLYSIFCISIYLYLTKLEKKEKLPHGLIGFIGIGLYGVTLLLAELLSGSTDMLESYIFINLNQAIGIIFMIGAFLGTIHLLRK